jgi:hypothetical protein
MGASRQMALTPDLVAWVHRVLEDPGPNPTWTYHADEDYDAPARACSLPILVDRTHGSSPTAP